MAESLIKSHDFDPKDQMEHYLRWYHDGHLSVTGECFDIGNTTRQALMAFEETGNPTPDRIMNTQQGMVH